MNVCLCALAHSLDLPQFIIKINLQLKFQFNVSQINLYTFYPLIIFTHTAQRSDVESSMKRINSISGLEVYSIFYLLRTHETT